MSEGKKWKPVPCPRCGNAESIQDSRDDGSGFGSEYRVLCRCGIATRYMGSLEEAHAEWNFRSWLWQRLPKTDAEIEPLLPAVLMSRGLNDGRLVKTLEGVHAFIQDIPAWVEEPNIRYMTLPETDGRLLKLAQGILNATDCERYEIRRVSEEPGYVLCRAASELISLWFYAKEELPLAAIGAVTGQETASWTLYQVKENQAVRCRVTVEEAK